MLCAEKVLSVFTAVPSVGCLSAVVKGAWRDGADANILQHRHSYLC